MPAIIDSVVTQHAENAGALWQQRHHAVYEPHYTFADLVHLDNRVEANLDGLRVAGEAAYAFVDENINAEEEGARFAKAVLLLEKRNRLAFLDMVEAVSENRQALEEIDSALAWVAPECLTEVVRALLVHKSPAMVELGIRACAVHRRPARQYIVNSLGSVDADLRATAMQVAADLGLVDCKDQLRAFIDFETPRETFYCGRALSLLGDQPSGRRHLSGLALGNSAYAARAVNQIALMNDVSSSKALLKTLDAQTDRQRDVVRGFGYLGELSAVDWLISKTEIPELCRLAGGSISMLTGIDLAEMDLETLDPPEGFVDDGPNDDPDNDNVDPDEDEDLPWPDPERIRAWWHSAQKPPAGRRYLNGRERTRDELNAVLKDAYQRQRNAAADCLALLDPGAAYSNTCSPTNKQKLWMH